MDETSIVDDIYDALDRWDPEEALRLAREAIAEPGGDDPVLRFLAGVALLELGLPADAVEELRASVEMDPDDAEFRARLAAALFRSCRFEEARQEAGRALESDEKLPDAHEIWAMILEREGRFDEAQDHLERASALDPERFPLAARMTREAFEREVMRAEELLPDEFRKALDRVAVTVEEIPSNDVLSDRTPPLDPEMLGLFVGVALPDRSTFSAGGELPPRILLFKRNLERYAADVEELREEIAVTLYHELGHYLGFDEDELGELELA